ncbi:hypothetical protein [Tenacibaculum geojense]|uniref:Uncharacterized protein n=1 Tax=Tenacibaculum geojense TaxID=915352 RepID=A0ABW3JM94_9FLAO
MKQFIGIDSKDISGILIFSKSFGKIEQFKIVAISRRSNSDILIGLISCREFSRLNS